MALRSARAFVLPTPASWNELQLTLRLLLTAQPGVPVWTCVPVGAFAGLTVVAAEAAAENTMTAANGTARRKRNRRNMIVSSEWLSVIQAIYRRRDREGWRARRYVAETAIARYEAGTGVAVRLLVVSVSLRFWNCTVIGGLQDGLNVAVAVMV